MVPGLVLEYLTPSSPFSRSILFLSPQFFRLTSFPFLSSFLFSSFLSVSPLGTAQLPACVLPSGECVPTYLTLSPATPSNPLVSFFSSVPHLYHPHTLVAFSLPL